MIPLWRRMLEMRAVDIARPDVLYLGGISRSLQVARMAANGLLAGHDALRKPVAGADCCPWLQGLLVTRPCRIADGRAVVGDAPGRGRDLARLAGAVPLSGPATRHERA